MSHRKRKVIQRRGKRTGERLIQMYTSKRRHFGDTDTQRWRGGATERDVQICLERNAET